MIATAKVLTTGNSQAIRLPKAFRVEAKEMWISKNEITGDITLKPKADEDAHRRGLEELFRMLRENPLPEDFLSESTRHNEPSRNPLAEWADESPGPKVKVKAKAKK